MFEKMASRQREAIRIIDDGSKRADESQVRADPTGYRSRGKGISSRVRFFVSLVIIN